MSQATTGATESPLINTRLLSYYIWAGVILVAVALVYAVFNLPPRYLYLAAAAPVAFVVVMSPKLALYQFVFALFLEYPLIPSIPLYLIDCSMVLVIVAGGLDFFLNGRWPSRLPPLTLNYGYLILAIVITGLFGYWPEIMPRRVISTTTLLATFLAVYRLTRRVPVSSLVRFFVGLAALHATIVLIPFVTSGGTFRSFSFYGVLFDDQAMVALPLAIGLFLSARKRLAGLSLVMVILILGGLVATQSRAPIVMGLAASAAVIWLAVRSGDVIGSELKASRAAARRVKLVLIVGLIGTAVMIIMLPEFFTTLGERFGQLLSSKAEGTTVYRLALWERAVTTFLDYPIFGVGPGGYYRLAEVYATFHITPNYDYLRTLGAHNLLLHYLADTGLVGGLGLVALMVNQYRLGRAGWHRIGLRTDGVALSLFGWAILFVVTTLVEANWMWGQLSFLAVFLAALVARQYRQNEQAVVAVPDLNS